MTTPNEQSSRELLPCPFCGGECDFCSTGVATPDHGDERRAIHEWLMREHKIEVLGNPEDDTAAVISLGTLRNIARVAMSAAQPVAQEAMRRDRETDRARFPDPEFNRWLDDSVADGVCVWDTIDDVHLAWIAWSTRDSYKSREAHMTVLDRDAKGVPTIWCDPEIADIVAALNTHGLKTVASCSGHGQQLGIVSLADGRELTIGTTAAREGVVHDWPACAVFRGGLCTCDAEDVAAKTGLDHFVADVEAAIAAPQPSQGADDDGEFDDLRRALASDHPREEINLQDVLVLLNRATSHHPASAEAGKGVGPEKPACYMRIDNLERMLSRAQCDDADFVVRYPRGFPNWVSPAIQRGYVGLYLRPSESVAVSGEVSEAVARIEQYVARRTGRRGLDPDVVVGIDADIELRLSDLRAVLALAGSGGKA